MGVLTTVVAFAYYTNTVNSAPINYINRLYTEYLLFATNTCRKNLWCSRLDKYLFCDSQYSIR